MGVGEVTRRIITKVLAKEIRAEIKEATWSVQCAGLKRACEAAVAAMEEQYEAGKAILILDVEGAYTSLNRSKAMRAATCLVPEAYQERSIRVNVSSMLRQTAIPPTK